jgi:uracil-DNA glycosylase family 4
MDKKSLLEWYLDAGVDEAIDNEPTQYFSMQALVSSDVALSAAINAAPVASAHTASLATYVPPAPASIPLHHTPSAAVAMARALADGARTLEELEETVRAFDGCAIKKTASKTVFSDGNPKARVMIIGEAPGAQEDKEGIPFCGPSGQLLDRMFAAIGLSRKNDLYISNSVFWRPPGNRTPNPEETATCLPFVEKHIALIKPALLILSGGTATTSLLSKDASISRLRGKIYDYTNGYIDSPIKTIVMYHPSYLLRQPGHKRLAWHDLLLVEKVLKGLNS